MAQALLPVLFLLVVIPSESASADESGDLLLLLVAPPSRRPPWHRHSCLCLSYSLSSRAQRGICSFFAFAGVPSPAFGVRWTPPGVLKPDLRVRERRVPAALGAFAVIPRSPPSARKSWASGAFARQQRRTTRNLSFLLAFPERHPSGKRNLRWRVKSAPIRPGSLIGHLERRIGLRVPLAVQQIQQNRAGR